MIVVLASDIKKEGNLWALDEWSLIRVAAGECFYKKDPSDRVIVVGGGSPGDDRPTVASLMSRYLIDKGVPESAIVSEDTSLSTLQELLQVQGFTEETGPKDISIISSEWHLERVRAILEYFPKLSTLNKSAPSFLAAEDILLRENPVEWENFIEKSRKNPETETRRANEKKGVAQIIDGTYHYR